MEVGRVVFKGEVELRVGRRRNVRREMRRVERWVGIIVVVVVVVVQLVRELLDVRPSSVSKWKDK